MGKGTTQQAVFLTLVCFYAHAMFTLLYAVTLKTDKKITKTKMERGEDGGGDIMTARSFAYMLACGNK